MDDSRQAQSEKILRLIGAIVLMSQEAERCLKVALPFLASDDPSLGAALRRAEKLKKRPLGDLTGHFVAASISDSPDFGDQMAEIVAARNRVVHHFDETYGGLLAQDHHADVIVSLEQVLCNLKAYRSVAEELALHVLEGLRDITFSGTPDHAEIEALCASFKARIAR